MNFLSLFSYKSYFLKVISSIPVWWRLRRLQDQGTNADPDFDRQDSILQSQIVIDLLSTMERKSCLKIHPPTLILLGQ